MPAFEGLLVHHDERFGFVVLVPDGWQRLDLQGSASGVFYAPDASDLLTGLAIDAEELPTRVRAKDLATLRSGLLDGLRRLHGFQLEHIEAESISDLLTLEARLTFRDGASARKRWVRLMYQGRTQIRLIAQAASPERFDYWEPMFFQAMRTIRFGDAY
ncbi:MAG TPA: hypothetical protein VFG86_22520 [Chloroflexota bacterium]|nr:hypothetical protein [Chloroflexota bacterium]